MHCAQRAWGTGALCTTLVASTRRTGCSTPPPPGMVPKESERFGQINCMNTPDITRMDSTVQHAPTSQSLKWPLGGCGPSRSKIRTPTPSLQTPGLARDGLRVGGGRRSPSDDLPAGGGGARVFQGNLCLPTLRASFPLEKKLFQWRAEFFHQKFAPKDPSDHQPPLRGRH